MKNSPQTIQPRIVIVGAGYTGMLAAVDLSRRTRRLGARITLG